MHHMFDTRSMIQSNRNYLCETMITSPLCKFVRDRCDVEIVAEQKFITHKMHLI